MKRLDGAFSVVLLSEGKLVAFRDPRGMRPLCIGRLDSDWVVASETCALDLVGAELEREIQPGGLVVVDDNGMRAIQGVPVDAVLPLPIPAPGPPAAIGYSRALGIPFSEGLIKNRYVGRTFIQPDQGLREQGIKLKFNPLAEVNGKRIVVVDDSIVRGNTTRQFVKMFLDAGAGEVPLPISPTTIIDQCF